MFVKICGLRTVEAVQAACESGADAIGFVFAPSPREVAPEQAVELCAGVPEHVIRVAVMRHPEPAACARVLRIFRPDWLQTDARDFTGLEVEPTVRRIPVYRDAPGLDEAAVAAHDRVLFEAADSGAGRSPDWCIARRLGETTELILAGGLDPDNVAEAIRQVRPWGVDVSSGVESERGVKDLARISAFFSAVREAESNDGH